MNRLLSSIATFFLFCTPAFGDPIGSIAPGDTDLRSDPIMGRPFTVLEQFLMATDLQAKEFQRLAEKSNFTSDYIAARPHGVAMVSTDVGYIEDKNRLLLYFSTSVNAFQVPWQTACWNIATLMADYVLQSSISEPGKKKEGNYLPAFALPKLVGVDRRERELLSEKIRDSSVIRIAFIKRPSDVFECVLDLRNAQAKYFFKGKEVSPNSQ